MPDDARSLNGHVSALGTSTSSDSPPALPASGTSGTSGGSANVSALVGSAASPSAGVSVYGRRMRLSILSILSVPVLFALAPLQVSMPFAVVALAAPLITTCDCRREQSNRAQQQQRSGQSAGGLLGLQGVSALKEQTTEAERVKGAMQHHQQQHKEQQYRSATEGLHSSRSEHGLASSELASSELSLVRSEERMVIRKERLVTSKLVVRKVVTTEMVVMSVPVRRERLEVETVQLDPPVVVHEHDDLDEQTAVATKGYVMQHTVGADGAAVDGAPFASDRYNYASVDDAGRPTIDLLLCEERPRVVMDLVPVSRVRVSKQPYASSQLVDMELRTEHIDYVAPSSSKAAIVQQW